MNMPLSIRLKRYRTALLTIATLCLATSASAAHALDLDAQPTVVLKSDFNGDGRPDLYVYKRGLSLIQIVDAVTVVNPLVRKEGWLFLSTGQSYPRYLPTLDDDFRHLNAWTANTSASAQIDADITRTLGSGTVFRAVVSPRGIILHDTYEEFIAHHAPSQRRDYRRQYRMDPATVTAVVVGIVTGIAANYIYDGLTETRQERIDDLVSNGDITPEEAARVVDAEDYVSANQGDFPTVRDSYTGQRVSDRQFENIQREEMTQLAKDFPNMSTRDLAKHGRQRAVARASRTLDEYYDAVGLPLDFEDEAGTSGIPGSHTPAPEGEWNGDFDGNPGGESGDEPADDFDSETGSGGLPGSHGNQPPDGDWNGDFDGNPGGESGESTGAGTGGGYDGGWTSTPDRAPGGSVTINCA